MTPNSTLGVFGPCPDRADLPKLLEQAKLMAIVKEAGRAISAYLWDTHVAFIQKHTRQDWGNKITTQSLALEVVTELLDQIESFTDIDHVCNSFRQRIVGRAIDRQRQRVRQQEAADSLSRSPRKRDPQSHTDELERLDLVQRMIGALSEHNPNWAAAIELRYLATDDNPTTYEALGRALDVTDSTALEWVTKGLEWLRRSFPDFRLV